MYAVLPPAKEAVVPCCATGTSVRIFFLPVDGRIRGKIKHFSRCSHIADRQQPLLQNDTFRSFRKRSCTCVIPNNSYTSAISATEETLPAFVRIPVETALGPFPALNAFTASWHRLPTARANLKVPMNGSADTRRISFWLSLDTMNPSEGRKDWIISKRNWRHSFNIPYRKTTTEKPLLS